MSQHYPHIFEPFTVKRTTFRNRVVMPPTFFITEGCICQLCHFF